MSSGATVRGRKLGPGEVGRRELAKILGVSPAHVTRYAADGMPVKSGGGRGVEATYMQAECVAWLAKRRANDGNTNSLAQERALLAAASRRRIELAMKRDQGEVVEVAEVARVWTSAVLAFKTRMRGWPRNLAPRLVQAAASGGARAVERVLTEAVRDALSELATMRVEDPAGEGGT